MTEKSLNNLKRLLNNAGAKEIYKAIRVLCGPTRFQIIFALNKFKQGLTVTELAKILNSSLSRVSHQLQILRRHKLVIFRGKNREVIYRLSDHRIQKHLIF